MDGKLFFSAIIALTVSACTMTGPPIARVDLLGDPVPLTAASRTIVIDPATKYVNVTGGETVKFVVGDKAFAWNFDTQAFVSPFDLSLAAPPGVLDHKVIAYVAPKPLYIVR